MSRVCGTFKEREGWHGCQMPIGVLNRIILASSNPGDIVLDPFNGSGTTVVAAALLGRKYVGIDQSEEYVGYAREAARTRPGEGRRSTASTRQGTLDASVRRGGDRPQSREQGHDRNRRLRAKARRPPRRREDGVGASLTGSGGWHAVASCRRWHPSEFGRPPRRAPPAGLGHAKNHGTTPTGRILAQRAGSGAYLGPVASDGCRNARSWARIATGPSGPS